MDELRPGLVNEEPEEGVLGDLVLCPAVAERQGETAGHGTDAEIELLTVHGILHLLGYDHAEPEEHQEMFGLQDELLAAWRRPDSDRPAMTSGWLAAAAALVLLAGAVLRAPTPRSSSFSRARAEELLAEGKAGAKRLVGAPRRPRPLPEHRAVPAAAVRDRGDRARHPAGPRRLGRRRVLAGRADLDRRSCWWSRSS